MHRLKRSSTLLIVVSLLCYPLISAGTQSIKIPAKGKSPTIDHIESSGVLDAGATILAPWLLQNPKTGQYIGPAAIVAQATAKALHVRLHYVDATWDTIVAGLVSHKYQIADAALFETKQRKNVIGFVTYDHSGTCYVVRPASPIHTLSDLNHSKYVYLGYTGYATGTLFHEKYPKTRIKRINPPPGSGPRIPALLNGRGDIAPIDSPLVFWVHQKWPNVRIIPATKRCFKHPDLVRPIGIGYPKDDPVFGHFLKQVIQAKEKKIQAAKLRFSQPKWLNQHK
ncbi:MAG TPA: transporter substrate-binding domain-containing protein [Gammaproteobacteria bacterium]|nr:transporter substrate-binding domain-containing protein [Gammaproteobacteria bacterium]